MSRWLYRSAEVGARRRRDGPEFAGVEDDGALVLGRSGLGMPGAGDLEPRVGGGPGWGEAPDGDPERPGVSGAAGDDEAGEEKAAAARLGGDESREADGRGVQRATSVVDRPSDDLLEAQVDGPAGGRRWRKRPEVGPGGHGK